MPPAEVLDVLGEMYETLLREEKWHDMLLHLSQLFDAAEAAFVEWPADIGEVRFFITSRRIYAAESETLYVNHYGAFDPARSIAKGAPAGSAANCVDFFTEKFVAVDEFYQGFLLPRGLRYRCAVKALDEADAAAAFFLFRRREQGPFGALQMQLLSHFAPHVCRLARLHHELRRLRTASDDAMALLDRLTFGVAIVDACGRVRTMNRRAGTTLRMADGLALTYGVLDAAAPEDSSLLAGTAAAVCGERGREQAFRIGRPSGKAPYIVIVAPARSMVPSPMAVVSIYDPESAPPLSGRRLMELYGLTQAEARLACDLATGKSPDEIARQRSVSISTVRSQLSAVLRKCQTPRQVDLIRLLCGISAVTGM